MSVFLLILKIIGWVLLGLVALVLLALCVRVRFRIEYSDENTSVLLKWLFLKIPVYPSNKPKKEKEEKKEEEPEKKEEKKEEEKKEEKPQGDSFLKTLYEAEGIDGLVAILKKVMSYTKTFFSNLLHSLVIDQLYLDVCCTRSDAASTAIYYGEVCAVLFPLLGSLASRCRMKKYDVNVYPDFIARFSAVSFVTEMHLTPMYLIGVTLAYGCKLVFGVLLKMLLKISGVKKSKKSDRNTIKNTKEKSEIK